MNTKKITQALTMISRVPSKYLLKVLSNLDPAVVGYLQTAINSAARLVGEEKMQNKEKLKEALRPIVKEILSEVVATIDDLKLKKGSVLQATSNIGRVSKGDKGTVVDKNDWQVKIKWKTKNGEVTLPLSDNGVNLVKKIK